MLITKLSPSIGAIVEGVDLSVPLDDDTFAAIHDTLTDNLVIFFRDQHLTVDQHKAFGRRFGELHVHPNARKEVPDHPEILVIQADENSKHVAGEDWHSDVSCDPEPPMGSILYLTEVPPDGGGDTMFANMYLAYERLSPAMADFLDGLSAIHESTKAHGYRKRSGDADLEFPAPNTRWSAPTRSPAAVGCTSTGVSRRTSRSSPGPKATLCSSFCTGTSRPPSSVAGSAGRQTRSPSGTIVASSTTHCSTTSPTAATATASLSAATNPSDVASLARRFSYWSGKIPKVILPTYSRSSVTPKGCMNGPARTSR